jgi:ABC-type transport system involved in cytochrome bd biosynthesis fused ATPase/permease subunit
MNEQQRIPLKLKKLTFHGMKGYLKSLSVDFSDEVSTVIYGENGCGKTSFLKGLHYFLAQDEEKLNSLAIKSIVCTFLHNNEEREITVNKHSDKDTEGFDWTDFNDSPLSNSTSLSI